MDNQTTNASAPIADQTVAVAEPRSLVANQRASQPPSEPNSAIAHVSKAAKAPETKAEAVLRRLRQPRGVSIEALIEATGWQSHSVRGFLSGTVKKKLGLTLTSEIGKDGIRRYRITRDPKPA